MNSNLAFALASGVVALAGLVRGFSGFGSALIMSPALSLLYGPEIAVPMMSLIDLPAVVYLLPEALRHGKWKSLISIGSAAVVTVPLGAWLLVHLDGETMRRAIGFVVMAFVVALSLGWRYRRVVPLPLELSVGAASGFLGGSMGISGPPIILFYLSGPEAARTARASIMGFFLFTSVIRLASYASFGLYTHNVLWRATILLPLYFGGVWIGSALFGRVSEAQFRRVAYVVLAGIALVALIS